MYKGATSNDDKLKTSVAIQNIVCPVWLAGFQQICPRSSDRRFESLTCSELRIHSSGELGGGGVADFPVSSEVGFDAAAQEQFREGCGLSRGRSPYAHRLARVDERDSRKRRDVYEIRQRHFVVGKNQSAFIRFPTVEKSVPAVVKNVGSTECQSNGADGRLLAW